MADVGDPIAMTSKGPPRFGVVTAVSGAMVTVRWDTGGETSLIPGPGALSVVPRPRTGSATARPTPSGATAAAKKTSTSGSRTGVARKTAPDKKPTAGRTPVAKKSAAKKATRRKEPVAKRASSSRTTGKRTR
jgi:hypothetical protein